MNPELKIDVAALDAPHRQALEEVIGHQLATSQRLIISVIEVAVPADSSPRPAQTLEQWTNIYNGLDERQIEEVDAVAKTRADLSRNLP